MRPTVEWDKWDSNTDQDSELKRRRVRKNDIVDEPNGTINEFGEGETVQMLVLK